MEPNKSQPYLRFCAIVLCISLLSCLSNNKNTTEVTTPDSTQYVKRQEVVATDKINLFELVKEIDDTLCVGKRTCLKIYALSNKYQLCRGYIDPHETINFTIDIQEKKIDGLHKIMNMSEDTIKFYFTPAEKGMVNVSPITLLLKDDRGNYHVVITSLKYYVRPCTSNKIT